MMGKNVKNVGKCRETKKRNFLKVRKQSKTNREKKLERTDELKQIVEKEREKKVAKNPEFSITTNKFN